MNNISFNMALAIRSGYLFVAREWQYLARFSLLPIGVSLITDLAMYYQKREISMFEDYLWNMPALALFGWFMFVEARLALMGERAGHLPTDPAYMAERKQALAASVLVWLLFVMGRTTILAYLTWGIGKSNPLINFFWLFLIGAGIWGIRFSVAHILAAVGYPIRRYIFQVNGIFISLRLAGLYLMTCLPVALVEYGLTSMILPQDVAGGLIDSKVLDNLPESSALSLIVLETLSDVVSMALATAVFSFALKDMLSRPRQEKTV